MATNRARELRIASGLTLTQAAADLDLTKSRLSRYERGEFQIPDDVKLAMAHYYGVAPAWLMGWAEVPSIVTGSNDNGDIEQEAC